MPRRPIERNSSSLQRTAVQDLDVQMTKSRLRRTGTHIHQEKTWTDQDTPNLTHWSHRWQTGHTIMEERQGVAAFEQVKMIAQSSCFYVLTSVISLILIARFRHFY